MEFPAVGYRNYSDGSLQTAGQGGVYWSSVTASSYYAYYLYFNSDGLHVYNLYKQYGYNVRCVR
ncbi:MAG: fibrobacter succinogenes major paralogous domain-containing protein [Rikenellaceae bacterium]|nr:fibrobacter succinogenes major paralogous domain-containing protein [Rikenellaceae bacterium]